MKAIITLAQSEVTARALGLWLDLSSNPRDVAAERQIVWSESDRLRNDIVQSFHRVTGLIERYLAEINSALHRPSITIVVDAIDPGNLSVTKEGRTWENLVAMLILTYPEILWLFGVIESTGFKDDAEFERLFGKSAKALTGTETKNENVTPIHSIWRLFDDISFDPLFDPSGLRNWVRNRTLSTLERAGVKGFPLPLRPDSRIAAAIDEEGSYSYFHAYTAYRFGCRAYVITKWSEMQFLFSRAPESPRCSLLTPWLLLEDMSLNFPDRPEGLSLSHLRRRADKLKGLSRDEPSYLRLLITTGQQRRKDTTLSENRSFLDGKAHGKGKILYKPMEGMFDLWAKAGLLRGTRISRRTGSVTGFSWPPKPQDIMPSVVVKGHGAPGKLLLVADSLIKRAERLKESNSVEDAILGAVLATESLELTGLRTPTTAVDALALKHEFEMKAECQFSGIAYHFRLRDRLHEVTQSSRLLGRCFCKQNQKNAILNAEMFVLNHIRSVLQDKSQYDEEQKCLNRVRHIHNTLWMRRKPGRFVFWPILRYLELLLSSFPIFLVVLCCWILLLAGMYSLSTPVAAEHFGFFDAISSFFSIGSPIHPGGGIVPDNFGPSYVVTVCLAIVAGFVHLGVFVNHLYSITTRK